MRGSGGPWRFPRATPIAMANPAPFLWTCGCSPAWPACCGAQWSLTRRSPDMTILCDVTIQEHRSGRAQPAPATGPPAPRRLPDPRSGGGHRRFPAGPAPPLRKGGVPMRRGGTPRPLPVLVATGWPADPDALHSGRVRQAVTANTEVQAALAEISAINLELLRRGRPG